MSRVIPDDGVPFEPLWAVRLAKDETRPEPVNWFERIAAPLGTPDESDSGPPRGLPEGVASALFADVDAMAAEARTRASLGAPEPPEIREMRFAAVEEARRVLAEAEERASVLESEARERGFAEGRAAGYTEGERAARAESEARAAEWREALRQDLTNFIERVEAERRRAWAEMEPEMIGLVFDIAKQVIKSEVEVNRAVVLGVVQNALRRVADTGALRVRVHAEDLEAVRSHRADLLAVVDGIRHLEIIEDRRVTPGGCVVETDAGSIDARIETQLDTVGETLNAALLQRDAPPHE